MLASVFLFLYISFLHPLHLSVCDIEFDSQNRSLEISQRIFADDLENVLRPKIGAKTDILNPVNKEQLSSAIRDYVLQNLQLQLNGKKVTPRYVGHEVDEDVVWVYMEVPNVRSLNTITVQNTLFFEVFEDQLTLINVKKDGKVRSLKLAGDQKEGTLRF